MGPLPPRHRRSRTSPYPRPLLGALALLALAGAAPAAGGDTPAPAPPKVWICKLPAGLSELPAGALHGLIDHLRQYPDVSLATPAQRSAARRILASARTVARRYGDPGAAARAGFTTRTVARRAGDRSAHYLHAEFLRERKGNRVFDPLRPKALIYVNQPDRPLVLVGVMYSVKRGERGPSPGGPITRWHAHTVCVKGAKRGIKPLDDGGCPAGSARYQGSEMMHVWFTHDLRSAFAIRAPEPELCRDGLIVGDWCAHAGSSRGM